LKSASHESPPTVDGVARKSKRARLLHPAALDSEDRYRQLVQSLPAAVYSCDADGRITLFNDAAVALWGRSPTIGEDLWCGSWRIYRPDGSPMPLDECPMAIALREGRSVRDEEIVIERPDGTRRHVLPHPEPVRDSAGNVIGATNMLVDITDRKQAEQTQSLLAAIVASSDDAIISKSLDGVITSWNAGAERIFGYTAEEAVGQSITMLIPPERLSEEEQIINRLSRRERIDHFETIRVAKDGRALNISLTVSPICDRNGRVTGASKVARDITDRKRSEEALQELRKQLQQVTDTMAVAVVRCTADHRYQWVNPGYAAIVQRSPEEVAGRPIAEIIGEEAYQVIRPHIERVLSGKRVEFEVQLPYKGVGLRWIRAAYVPTYGSGAAPDGWVGVIIDIDQQKQFENDLREADRRKDEFLAVLAHELRNPLAPICSGLELMRLAGDDRALVEEVRATMERQTRQMVRLIDDLLDVSRITRGTVELRKCRVELASIVQSAVETARPIIEDFRHRLTISLPREPVVLEADPTRIAQVIANLLNNAAKYMQRGGSIELKAHREGEWVTVSVKDSGIGIPAAMLDRVFDMFTQVDRSLEQSQSGLGIGLTLVKRLVEMHGGSVEAHSAGNGQGSEFVVRLPVVVGSLSDADGGNDQQISATRKRRVLVVDDNEQAGKVLGMLLKALGNEVRTACDGLAAIDVAAEFRPDVILMDIGMPKLNGFETARRIREQPWGQKIVLAALTGWGQDEDRRRSKEAGFDYHFVKPVEPATLKKLLAE
jgi:PAS domain S-box-containing protein